MKVICAICIALAAIGPTGAAAYATRHYYAACHHPSHGDLGYSGPGHREAGAALRDCAEHGKVYPRHRCVVEAVDY